MDITGAFINGKTVLTKDTLDDVNPATGTLLAKVARCGSEEVTAATVAAANAYRDTWRTRSPAERGAILREVAVGIRNERTALAELESLDTGKPLSQALTDVDVAARYFEFYGGAVDTFFGDVLPSGAAELIITRREPYGVTGHIIPWNYPLQIGARTTAPSLAVGNCCVLKPAEEAPLSALRLASIAHRCGVPSGAFNVVPGLGEEAGALLVADERVRHISFTGSVEVGREVGAVAARRIIPVVLELGGKSPNIVFADANLDRAIPTIANSILQAAGQTCSAGSRLLVQRQVADEVVDRLVGHFKRVRIGPGVTDPDLGPLISSAQRNRVEAYVEVGGRESRLVAGGKRPSGHDYEDGFYFEPTIFTDVPAHARIAQEEIFGPVLAVMAFDDVAQATELANGTPYGLIAAVWTQDLDRAAAIAREVEAGQVFVNTYGASGGPEMPFGGTKASGHGREKGFAALFEFSHIKTIAFHFETVR